MPQLLQPLAITRLTWLTSQGNPSQRALLDLQAIQRIPGLAGYWPADPAYLFEDSAGMIPASVGGVAGSWTAANPVYTLGSEANTAPTTLTTPTDCTNNGDGSYTFTGTTANRAVYPPPLSAGALRISFTVSNYVSGTLRIAWMGVYSVGATSNGAYVLNLPQGVNTDYKPYFEAITGSTLTISNISIKQVTSNSAYQSTTTKKPILRRTPTSNVYWLNSDTDDELTATLGNLGSDCTVAKSGAEGVTFTEGVTISSTYNIAPAYGFNGDVAIFNRALTVTEKALLTLYMQRGVPVLGANLVTNGTFDTSTAGWTAFGSGIVESSAGKLKITRSDETTSVYQQISPSGKALLFSGSVEIVSGTGVARFRASSLSSLNNYGTIYLGEAAPFVGRVFVPPIATIYVNCAATTAPCVTQFDDISVRPIL